MCEELLMFRRELPHWFEIHRAANVVLALVAVSGWGAFILVNQSSANIESQLRAQVASLSQIQMDLLSEQTRAQATMGDWKQLQAQLPAVREELRQLTDARDQAQSELVLAQLGLSEAINRASQAHEDVSTTGSVGSKAPDPKQAVAATAQKALSKLGYGKLTADGVVGPGTRRAIEAFQRDKGLTVTSELDAPTLKQLTQSLKVAAR
jgi:chromosome segregation ATPase